MDSGGGGGRRTDAERSISLAKARLEARDLDGCKRFAEKAIESDPLADGGADRLLAAAEVLIAADSRRINNHVDWYSVLGLDSSSEASRQPPAVRTAYRRLALLLRAENSSSAAFSEAFRFVSEAWSILSDPPKKSLLDSELQISAAAGAGAGAPAAEETFWTACSSCCHVHQYDRLYLGRTLRCPNCRKGFVAAELAEPPPIVPGTDTYYCSWGIYPLGFAGSEDGSGEGFSGTPVYPWGSGVQPGQPIQSPTIVVGGGGEHKVNPSLYRNSPTSTTPPSKNVKFKKAVAKKKVGVGAYHSGVSVIGAKPTGIIDVDINGEEYMGAEARPVGVDINEVVEEGDGDDDMPNFAIDLDAAKELLSDLPGLPFLKEDD